MDDSNLLRRGERAYWAEAERERLKYPIPGSFSGVEEYNGRIYVCLRNGGGLLRTYRIKNDGRLKSLRRPPAALK